MGRFCTGKIRCTICPRFSSIVFRKIADHPHIPFERYADDAICHCCSEEQARALRVSLEKRFAECGLTLHPDKTKVVYCNDDDRRCDFPDHKFDFLGYTFRPRLSRRRNGFGVSFSPAVSGKALKSIRQTVRHWTLHERSDKTLDDLARMFNNNIRGWINYYGCYYKSALYPALRHIDRILAQPVTNGPHETATLTSGFTVAVRISHIRSNRRSRNAVYDVRSNNNFDGSFATSSRSRCFAISMPVSFRRAK
jgi:Group II intron, maturase-specific domain/Reverse transcriptase (RNA-dependent DNA polymerase)